MPLPSLQDEMHIALMLKARGVPTNAFEGLTTVAQREETFRQAITKYGPSLPAGKFRGSSVTFGQLFQLVYGSTL